MNNIKIENSNNNMVKIFKGLMFSFVITLISILVFAI